jgi:hypothetical protein
MEAFQAWMIETRSASTALDKYKWRLWRVLGSGSANLTR